MRIGGFFQAGMFFRRFNGREQEENRQRG
jgi:hypothetical protein